MLLPSKMYNSKYFEFYAIYKQIGRKVDKVVKVVKVGEATEEHNETVRHPTMLLFFAVPPTNIAGTTVVATMFLEIVQDR